MADKKCHVPATRAGQKKDQKSFSTFMILNSKESKLNTKKDK
jgi:hypothetical protein